MTFWPWIPFAELLIFVGWQGQQPEAMSFKHIKDLKWGEERILSSSSTSTQLCALFPSGWMKSLLSSHIPYSLFKKRFYILHLAFQLNECWSGVHFLWTAAKCSHWWGKQAEKNSSISMLTELSALSFLISVLIINTNKTYGHITLFILIRPFKTKSLCWTFWHLRTKWALIKSQSDFGGQLVVLLPPDSQSICLSRF